MGNLKKVLSLVVVFAMAFTMMAGAAYSDQKDIVNSDAVNMLSALNIIKGGTDGNFNPTKTVTRAEMAKMIYVLKNAGNDDGATYYKSALAGADGKPVFSDVSGHWAQGYINWAYSLNIINGRGNRKFDPDASVTGLEAAKMLLTVLGYKPATEGMTGNTWAIKAAALASENGLFNNYTVALGQGCPRDFAALMISNALDAKTVVYRDGVATTKNVLDEDNQTLGKKAMNLDTYEGVLQASGEYGVLASGSKDKITLKVEKVNGSTVTSVVKTFDYKVDASAQVGQYVKVSVSNPTNKDSKVYGVYTMADKNLVLDTKVSKVEKANDDDKIKVDGTEYKLAGSRASIPVYTIYGDTTTYTSGSKSAKIGTNANLNNEFFRDRKSGERLVLIDNTDDDKIDFAIWTPVTVGQVSSLTSSSYSVKKDKAEQGYSVLSTSGLKVEDSKIFTGMAKDDYVVVVDKQFTYDDKYVVTKADTVEGKVSTVKKESGLTTEFKIGDTTYKMANGIAGPGANDKVKIAAYNGIAYISDATAAGSSDFAVVTGVAKTLSMSDKLDVKLVFADGTEKVVSVEKINGADIKTFDVTKSTPATTDDVPVAKNTFVAYDEDDGDYSLRTYANFETVSGKTEGYDAKTDAVYYNNGKLNTTAGTVYLKDEAVVYVIYDTDKVKVLTGKDVKAWGDKKYDAASGAYAGSALYNNDDGRYAKIACLNLGAKSSVPGASSDKYGYLLSAPQEGKVDGTTYNYVKLWDGKSGTEYMCKTTTAVANASKGDVFKYDVLSDGKIDVSSVLSLGKATNALAITSYDKASKEIQVANAAGAIAATYEITDDTVILYVDTDGSAGVDSGDIQVADVVEVSGVAKYVKNAFLDAEATTNSHGNYELKVLVIDTKQNWRNENSYCPKSAS